MQSGGEAHFGRLRPLGEERDPDRHGLGEE